MGEVYRARDTRLHRSVALKTIRDTANDAVATERLIAEARAAAALSHPNIAQIYDIGERAGVAYVVMELVEGMSLEAKLCCELEVAEVLSIGMSLASALGAAHSRGVIHRDIKPANILVTPTGHIKVLDFGLAKRMREPAGGDAPSLTNAGTAMGTTAYMSPEQAFGEPVTPATDVFAAGVVLYRMTTGSLPFTGNSVFQVMDRVLHADPAPILRADVPQELKAVIKRALDKNPSVRYADGAALECALRDLPAAGAATSEKIGVAVLPFDDLSVDGSNEYFSSGLADEITAALSNIDALAVVSRTTASRYKKAGHNARSIASDLRVSYVLDGSVRKTGDALRITAQLVEGANDATVWAQTYNGTLRNVFEIQEEVARKIVSALTLRLSPAEKVTLGKRATLDAEAFDLYLRGRHHVSITTRLDLQLALSLFELALERDARYAAAHAGVAEASAAYYEYYDRSDSWLDRSVDSALKALMYDPRLAEGYAALALAYFNKGSLDDSRSACRRAIELDPENWIGYWTLARIHYVTGRGEDAIALLQRAIALNPEYYVAYFTLRMVCQALDREEIYRPYLARLIDEVFPNYLARNPADARGRNSYGMELSMAGRTGEGRAEVERALAEAPDDPMLLYATACYHAVFGDRGDALAMLARALGAGYANFAYMAKDPDLRRLHGDPGYEQLLRERGASGASLPGG